MKFIIHFTVGTEEDSIVIEGASLESIREQAQSALAQRGGIDPWSEEIQ